MPDSKIMDDLPNNFRFKIPINFFHTKNKLNPQAPVAQKSAD